ncbi:hypothetical protein SLEP1_g30962 [Rubroshorea leprosula]|uniref:Uncharacterized protein n=1 Tax=Rubroshorea leprosula TaxID=152421 RepID=A0AAV5K778_9ROSI|nr:hypothetical protein SLEP1_g30962 [Rubroshorea leprosula]
MAGTRDRRLRRKLKKTLRRMKAKAPTTRAEMSHAREEMAQMVASMEDLRLELDLMKASRQQQFDDMLLDSEAVDTLIQIILQL